MVKSQKDSRTYDDEGFIRRSACLCFKDETEKEILLISSSDDAQKWIIPGGGIEPYESPRDAASREALEEAGVIGCLGRYLGTLQNCHKNQRTALYVLTVHELLEEWKEQISRDRKRRWFSLEEAKTILAQKPGQIELLELLYNSNS